MNVSVSSSGVTIFNSASGWLFHDWSTRLRIARASFSSPSVATTAMFQKFIRLRPEVLGRTSRPVAPGFVSAYRGRALRLGRSSSSLDSTRMSSLSSHPARSSIANWAG